MKTLLLTTALIIFMCNSGCSQSADTHQQPSANTNPRVGGDCEGCEAIYESDIAFEKLNWADTLPGYNNRETTLEISGVVYKRDGKTPAKNIVLYIYHTDQAGIYPNNGNESGWGKRHGYLRGWVKTNESGEYRFLTTKPASYPQSKIPAHIHMTIKEPGINEYYIDDFLFEDDVFLTAGERQRLRNYGGNGIVKLNKMDGILVGKRNIILGLNVPGYPKQ